MRLAALGLVAAALLIAGCGGGGDDEPTGPDPNAVLACAQDGGLKGLATQADSGLGTTGGLQLRTDGGVRIVVDFFGSPEEAQTYSEGQGSFLGGAGGNGSSEVVGETTVIATDGPGAQKELALVRGCLS